MNARVCDGKKDPDAAAGIENLTNDHAKPQEIRQPARLFPLLTEIGFQPSVKWYQFVLPFSFFLNLVLVALPLYLSC